MREAELQVMRRRAVGPTADPDVEEHNKTCWADAAGRQRESALMEDPGLHSAPFSQSPVCKRLARIFLDIISLFQLF